MKTKNILPLLGLALLCQSTHAFPQSSVFTYQGRLNDASGPATGLFDLRFVLYDAESGGNTVSSPVVACPLAVSNGLFHLQLDFGSAPFSGAARWLEISVRTNGSAEAYTTMTPRQPITPVPYAISAQTAASVPMTNLTGTLSSNQLPASVARLDADQTFTGRINFMGGNVGIGTTNPRAALDVRGSAHVTDYGRFGENHWTTEGMDYEALDTFGGTMVRGNSINVGKLTIGSWSQAAPINGLFVAGNSWLDGNVGVGTATPSQKLTVAGVIESTGGGFRFPDGTVQTTATQNGEDFLIYQDATGSIVAYNAMTHQVLFASADTSEVLRRVHEVLVPGQKITVRGDLTVCSSITLSKRMTLEWNGTLHSRVPGGASTFILGSPDVGLSFARLVFGKVDGNSLSDFITVYNATFNDISVGDVQAFRYVFLFAQGSGAIHAQNTFHYTVLANNRKAFYFPSPSAGSPPAFGEGNQMMGGAIFDCDYGIHAESGTDCGGMTVQGVIDNGNPDRRDYWNESDIGIGSLLQMAFIRQDYSRLTASDLLINAFGALVNGLGGIELGSTRGSITPYIDFHRFGDSNADFNVRLANYEDGTLTANADRFVITGDCLASNFQTDGLVRASRMELSGSTPYVDFHYGSDPADYNVRIINDGNRRLTLHGNLDITGKLTYASLSDVRLKKNVCPVTNALKRLVRLQGVHYDWINPEEHGGSTNVQGGFVAQQVETVFPDWVRIVAACGQDAKLTVDGRAKAVELPAEFNAYVVEAIKELNAEMDSLRAVTQVLLRRLEALESRSTF